MARGRRVYAPKLDAVEKRKIGAECEKLIAEALLPRFLPEIKPTEFNYPVGLAGKWHGNKYRFVTRYRSGFEDNKGEEFDAPFTRLEWVDRNRFDLAYFRHTEQWWPLHHGLTLEQALKKIVDDRLLWPTV